MEGLISVSIIWLWGGPNGPNEEEVKGPDPLSAQKLVLSSTLLAVELMPWQIRVLSCSSLFGWTSVPITHRKSEMLIGPQCKPICGPRQMWICSECNLDGLVRFLADLDLTWFDTTGIGEGTTCTVEPNLTQVTAISKYAEPSPYYASLTHTESCLINSDPVLIFRPDPRPKNCSNQVCGWFWSARFGRSSRWGKWGGIGDTRVGVHGLGWPKARLGPLYFGLRL